MPILVDCPYDCGELLCVAETEDGSTGYLPHDCEGCGRRIWTFVSRLDPWSMTEQAFLEEYEVDEETKKIRPRAQANAE